MTLASRLAATCDAGSGAGGRASAFRTAPGFCPRPMVSRTGPGAMVISTLRRSGSGSENKSRTPKCYRLIKHLNRLTIYVIRRHEPPIRKGVFVPANLTQWKSVRRLGASRLTRKDIQGCTQRIRVYTFEEALAALGRSSGVSAGQSRLKLLRFRADRSKPPKGSPRSRVPCRKNSLRNSGTARSSPPVRLVAERSGRAHPSRKDFCVAWHYLRLVLGQRSAQTATRSTPSSFFCRQRCPETCSICGNWFGLDPCRP